MSSHASSDDLATLKKSLIKRIMDLRAEIKSDITVELEEKNSLRKSLQAQLTLLETPATALTRKKSREIISALKSIVSGVPRVPALSESLHSTLTVVENQIMIIEDKYIAVSKQRKAERLEYVQRNIGDSAETQTPSGHGGANNLVRSTESGSSESHGSMTWQTAPMPLNKGSSAVHYRQKSLDWNKDNNLFDPSLRPRTLPPVVTGGDDWNPDPPYQRGTSNRPPPSQPIASNEEIQNYFDGPLPHWQQTSAAKSPGWGNDPTVQTKSLSPPKRGAPRDNSSARLQPSTSAAYNQQAHLNQPAQFNTQAAPYNRPAQFNPQASFGIGFNQPAQYGPMPGIVPNTHAGPGYQPGPAAAQYGPYGHSGPPPHAQHLQTSGPPYQPGQQFASYGTSTPYAVPQHALNAQYGPNQMQAQATGPDGSHATPHHGHEEQELRRQLKSRPPRG